MGQVDRGAKYAFVWRKSHELRLLVAQNAVSPAREVVSQLRASNPFHAQTAPVTPERKTEMQSVFNLLASFEKG